MNKLLRNLGAILMAGGGLLAIIQRTIPALATADLASQVHGFSPAFYVIFRTLDGPQALAFYVGAVLYGIGAYLRRRARKTSE